MQLMEFVNYMTPPLEDGGYTYLATITKNEGGSGTLQQKHFLRTNEGYTSRAGWHLDKWMARGDEFSGIFYTPFVFNDGRRTQENAQSCRVLWLDVDLDPLDPEKYGSVPDATAALRKFLEDTSFPKPNVMVSTGHGLHVYWRLDRPVAKAHWDQIAGRLKALTVRHGLKVDHACTADSARILRIPGTFNRKGPPRPVRAQIGTGDVSLRDVLVAVKDVKPAAASTAGTLPDDLKQAVKENFGETGTDGFLPAVADEYPPVYMERVVTQCQYLAYVAANGGEDCSEPMWKSVLDVAAVCEDGEEWAHKLSSGHPNYDQDATDAKFERCLRTRKPARCDTLRSVNSTSADLCHGCPHHGIVKSPAVLGEKPKPAVVGKEELHIPWGYYINRHGVWKKADKNDPDAEDRRVTQYEFRKLEIHTYEERLSDLQWRGVLTVHIGGEDAQYLFTPEEASSSQSLAKWFNIKGLSMNTNESKAASEFTMSWLAELRRQRHTTRVMPGFGWGRVNDEETFTVADTAYTQSGKELKTFSADRSLAHDYTPVGTLEKWKEDANRIAKHPNPILSIMLATAFAAPLVRLTGRVGLAVNICSRASGVGKTTALRVAQAVWGDPHAVHQLHDTENSVAKKLADLRNLPCYWDEVRSDEALESYARLLFSISGGSEKARLNRDATAKVRGRWETMFVSATNNSLRPHVAEAQRGGSADAGLARLVEFEIYGDTADALKMPRINAAPNISDNYGHAGVVYAKWLIENKDTAFKMLDKVDQHLSALMDTDSANRFWISVYTVLLVGAQIAKKLGLVDFDLAAMKEQCVHNFSVMTEGRADVQSHECAAYYIDRFLERCQLNRNVLVTDRLAKSGPGNAVTVLYPQPGHYHGPLLMQKTKAGNEALVIKSELQKYVKDEFGVNRQVFNQLIRAERLPVRDSKRMLGAGTSYVLPTRNSCLYIKLPPGASLWSVLRSPTPDHNGDDDE